MNNEALLNKLNSIRLDKKKIGVLVENLYIPKEIKAYQNTFEAMGAEVQLMSRLWGNSEMKFISDPNGKAEDTDYLVVKNDFDSIRVEEYAAIIAAANYVSVRLRYFKPPEQPEDAPAVRFFARAMGLKNIIKGALCHGLWILTPRPHLLRGRHITCHEVVRADILNAGAFFTDSPDNVLVDDDLVTGHSIDDVDLFIYRIAEAIHKRK